MEEQVTKKRSGLNWIALGIGGVAIISLCICMTLAGFAIGRVSVTPEKEVVSETVTEMVEVEVTREIIITVESAQSSEDSVPATAEPVEPTAIPTAVPEPTTPPRNDIENQDFAIFYEVWDLVNREFDGELPPDEEIIYSAINGSLESLGDRYTTYVPPDVAAQMREDLSGSVSGIGAVVFENDDGFIEIVSPIEGQPADLVGLLPGDIIVAVDGESVIGMGLTEVVLLVRGPEGSIVNLTVVREGVDEELEFTIIRATFDLSPVESELLADGQIGYIRLSEFDRSSSDKIFDALNELVAANPKGLILDLRNNPGGLLVQTIEIADYFLPKSIVLIERNGQGLEQEIGVEDGDIAEDYPLVVLVNEGSASASEIIAGAVQDNERGVIIGVKSFGKGSVQSVYQLSDGSELRVTIARWYTPNNVSITDEGVTPDIEVEMPVSVELGSEEDLQLQRAIDYLLSANN